MNPRDELREKEREVSRLKRTLEGKDRQLLDLGDRLDLASKDVEKLRSWLKAMDVGVHALLGSGRWKIGRAAGRIHSQLRRRPRIPMVEDHLNSISDAFNDWREEKDLRPSPFVSPPSPALGSSTVQIERSGESPATPEPEAGNKKIKVSVIAWDVTHNPMGRAYLIADILGRKFDVEVIGAKFPKYGTEIWEPVRDARIPTTTFPGESFPGHFTNMEEVAERVSGDVVLVSKPRLPSYELGILAKRLKNRPLILDVDDHELSFFEERESLTLEQAEAHRVDPDFLIPHGSVWTRYCEGIIPRADAVTVSNAELQRKYGGTIFTHAKDEAKFDPALHDRDVVRAKFGFAPEDKVILFIGTPRMHKGVVDIAEALAKIGDPRYKLCIIGTVSEPRLRARLEQIGGDHVRVFENQPYSDLPANLSAGDLVCLLQDPKSEISKYQMPAKFIDALAMEIPILATNVPPLAEPAAAGLVELLGDTPLEEKIEEIFSNHEAFKRRAVENRKAFLAEYSYAAASEKVEKVILPLLESVPPFNDEFEKLLNFHREEFPPRRESGIVAASEKSGDSPRSSPPGGLEKSGGAGGTANGVAGGSGYVDDKYDIVFFWKQNDTGIYGRRQEMIVKYLARSPKVNRIVHFDAPMDIEQLRSLPSLDEGSNTSQSNMIFQQTISRLLGLENSGKVKHYTFVRAAQHSPDAKVDPFLERLLPGQRSYLKYIAGILEKNGIGKRKTIFWICPTTREDFLSIAASLKPDLVVADVIDDQRTWPEPGSPWIARYQRNYEEVLGLSDITLANCEPVKQSMLEFTDDIHVIPNALELPEAVDAPSSRPEDLLGLEGPIVGYVGNLSSRIDIDLLEHIATARPEWNIVLIGSAHLSTHPLKDIRRLDVYDNIHFLGAKKYSEAQQYIKSFDVAIIPHLDNEMTRSMNPLKLFVYCSLNVPVVSTKVDNLGELRELIRVAETNEDFVLEIESALKEERASTLDPKHMALLKRNSWDARVEEILALIDKEWASRAKNAASVSGQR